MSVGCAAALLGSGSIGDDYGGRGKLVAGALLLTAGSALGAVAPSALVLVAGQIVQGFGGAAVIACGLGLIGHAYRSGRARARATAAWGAALGHRSHHHLHARRSRRCGARTERRWQEARRRSMGVGRRTVTTNVKGNTHV